MASHRDTAPATPKEQLTATNLTRSRSSFFRNSFNASLLSLSSVRTLLPHYTVLNTSEESPTSPLSELNSSPSGAPPSWDTLSAIQPPRYSLEISQSWPSTSTATRFEIEDDPQPHDFRYSYPIRLKNPWATLHLHTRSGVPGNSDSMTGQPRVPRFWSCDPMTGTVQLDLDSSQNIHQISITIQGRIILSSHPDGFLPFLSREFTVWDKSFLFTENKKVDPRLPSGQHTFPFSFPFPMHADPVLNPDSIEPFSPHTIGTTLTSVASPSYDNNLTITEKQRFTSALHESHSSERSQTLVHSSVSPMPQTFIEKDVEPNVAYDISVRIVHGRFKTSSRIDADILYIPASEPLPSSQKRREAYEAGALVPCPMDDPEGWFAFPTVKIYGVVKFNSKLANTRVDCTLYIAQPLSYPRGSVIPCFITIHSDDAEVARLLVRTSRPTLRLLRRIWHPMASHETESSIHDSCLLGGLNTGSTCAMGPTSDMTLVTHKVGHANWWMPSKEIVEGPNSRHLEGEVHLSPDLQPSCDFQLFRIEYTLELLSFQTANFIPDIHPPSSSTPRKRDNVVASNPIEITTLYRQDEPVPSAYSEPPQAYRKLRISSDKVVSKFRQ